MRPNQQQIPSSDKFRNCFKSEKGVFVDCDYSAQEIFVIADGCNETKMIEFLKGNSVELAIHNGDFHAYTATLMYRLIENNPDLLVTKKSDKAKRDNAKAINFKIAFGGSAFTLKDDFGVDEKTAQTFIDGYFNAFPELKANFEARKKAVLKTHEILIDPYTGRKWYSRFKDRLAELDAEKELIYSQYPNKWKAREENPRIKQIGSEYYTTVGKLERNALNYSIQGLAASMTKLASILIRNWIKENNLWEECKILTLVHDQILGWCVLERKEEFGKVISENMMKASTYFLNHLVCSAEPEYNTVWKK
jgi:DNA polymerase-1